MVTSFIHITYKFTHPNIFYSYSHPSNNPHLKYVIYHRIIPSSHQNTNSNHSPYTHNHIIYSSYLQIYLLTIYIFIYIFILISFYIQSFLQSRYPHYTHTHNNVIHIQNFKTIYIHYLPATHHHISMHTYTHFYTYSHQSSFIHTIHIYTNI
ncbi:uncharacterized protein LOC126320608 [Schistocerca gregaria]|uniref:uncharacterized protein LOC126320608 n=1 Tax=Schistocerca gregaria TaxID=7010 RepID=UPI00211E533C|nr:uncharacterized protein LOC126320608 [Schistocerca gregaria]